MSFNPFGLCSLQDRERQFWCPAPLREGEQHRRKLKSDKYQLPVARLLENYGSDSLVEADEDTTQRSVATPGRARRQVVS
jgi:hypothetical protein